MDTKRWLVYAYIFLTAGLTLALTACGGGGGGVPPPPDTSAAAGFWHGTSTDQNNNTFPFGGIISTDGQLRFLIDEGDCFGTQFKGTFTMDGNAGSGTFTGYAGGICVFDNGGTLINGTINFTIVGTEITGTFSSQEYSGTFSLTYDPQADNPITLADLAGTWIGEEGDFSEIIVSADGSFTGTDDVYGCDLTGQISVIDPDLSITDVSVTVSGCDEPFNNDVYTGLGIWQQFDEGRETFAIVVSGTMSSAFGFFALLSDSGGDLWQGTWTLNTQETDWGIFNPELPLYTGSFLEIVGNSLRVVFIRDGLVEIDTTGTFSVEGTTFTSQIDGQNLVGTYNFQNNNTKVVIYWSAEAGGDTEVYDKQTATPVYAFGLPYLQYRVYENTTSTYQAWVPMTKNNIPIQETDINDIRLLDSVGNVLTSTSEQFLTQTYMFLNCTATPCVQSGPYIEHAFLSNFTSLPADTYSFVVDTADGQVLNLDMPYPGQLVLPIVASSSMLSTWVGNDLALSWVNPTDSTNWSEVDQLRIRLLDSSGKVVLFISMSPTANNVTIDNNLLVQAAGLGDFTLSTWEVQTRAYNANNMNFARGISFRVAIATP
ncbi:MAG: hypothetical protein OES33_11770 [Desulfobulbaceae bacterium]|nr:hypothetical protein [Desulfobulbaceae bacterium]